MGAFGLECRNSCPDGYFGLQCLKKCNCTKCNSRTGRCLDDTLESKYISNFEKTTYSHLCFLFSFSSIWAFFMTQSRVLGVAGIKRHIHALIEFFK